MKTWRTPLIVFAIMLLSAGCSQADDIDSVLAQAKKNGSTS